MTEANEPLFVIKLPAQQKTVLFKEIPKLIGIAVFESKYGEFDGARASEDDWIRVHLVGIDYEETLKKAALTGEIEVLNPTTLRPLELAVGAMLEDAIVKITDLRKFMKGLNGEVELQQPASSAQSHEEIRMENVDWQFWRAMRKAKDWQACALSLNIDPDTLKHHPQGWMAGPDAGPIFTANSFKSKAAEEKFGKRMRLLRANRYDRAIFTLPLAGGSNLGPDEVLLSELAAWGVSAGWDDMPPDLAAFAPGESKPNILPNPQPSPVVSDTEWDELIEREDASRQDDEYRKEADRVAALYVERDRLLEFSRRGIPVEPHVKQRLSEISKELTELDAASGMLAGQSNCRVPFAPEAAQVVPTEESSEEQGSPAPAGITSKRLSPGGGDSLTPMIWEICYNLRDDGQKVTAKPVMAELKVRAEKRMHPLVGNVRGGVAYEYDKGEETELDAEQLRGRIKEWRRKTGN